MKILVIDDDPALREGVVELLSRHGIDGSEAENAQWADSLVRTHSFAAIVLDLGLPDGDGLDLLRDWRRRGIRTPVIVVSARGAPDDRADGIMAGADDYLGKPYHARELLARIQRVVHGSRPDDGTIAFGASGQYSYNLESQLVQGPDGDVALSGTLRRVLSTLIAARQRPISKEALLDQVSSEEDPASANAVEQWMRRLRAKLGADTIMTEPGLGYRLRWPGS